MSSLNECLKCPHPVAFKNRFEIHVVFYKQSGVTNQFPSNDCHEDWVIVVHHLLALSR